MLRSPMPTSYVKPARAGRRALLLASACAGALLVAAPALAQLATWTNTVGTGEYDNPANWDTNAIPVAGIALFPNVASGTIFIDSANSIELIGFAVGGSAYVITVEATGSLTLAGAAGDGITNNSSFNQTFINDGTMTFTSGSTVFGDVTINNNAILEFNNNSSAGAATINSNAILNFNNTSSAGSGTITTQSGGTTSFGGTSSGGTAAFVVDAGGTLQFAGSYAAAGTSVGSIAGAGAIDLATKTLTVGGDNTSTIFSGVISSTGGGGAIVKTGTGTLTLTGSNTYTGDTTINSGTLRIGDGGMTGSIQGDVVNNGTLAFNRSDDITFGGTISGSGALVKSGAGTLTLTGANTFGGGTTINAGAIQIDNTGALGTGTVTLNSGTLASGANGLIFGNAIALGAGGGTIDTSNGDGFNLFGAITGTGGLTKTGSGGLIISNAGWSGGLNINAGNVSFIGGTIAGGGTVAAGASLDIGNGAAAGAITGTIANDGQISVTPTAGMVFAATVTGTGQFTKSGVNTLTLTGDVSQSQINVAAGTLQVGNGGTTGSIAGNVGLGGGTTLVFNRSDDLTFGGDIDGTGALTKLGAGTLTLTGANTYSGGTTINGGTIRIDNSGALGTGAVALNGGTLASGAANITLSNDIVIQAGGGTINGDNFTLSGQITGTGVLTKVGAGTLILSNAGNAQGGNTVLAGTVRITNSGALGANGVTLNGGALASGMANMTYGGAVTLGANGGAIDTTNGDNFTLSGAVTGAGTLTKNGAGTLIVANAGWTGGTIVSAGNLTIGGGTATGGANIAAGAYLIVGIGTSGALTGNVTGAGFFIFNRQDDLAFAGDVSGVILLKDNVGALTLTGTSAPTQTIVDAGTLRIGDGGTSGSLAGNVTLNAALAFNRSDAITFAGAISGMGTLAQEGMGTLNLTGDSSAFSGTTNVDAGTLAVNGALGGAVNVVAGATLGGTGTIGGTVTVNGVIAPGNSIGTLTINGSLVLGAGSTTRIEVSAATADKIVVNGGATLAGTLQLVPVGGGFAFNTNYVILTAANGVSSTFGAIVTQGTFGPAIKASVGYGPNDVTLYLEPSGVGAILGGIDATQNVKAVAAAFDAGVLAGGDSSPFFALLNLPADKLPGAINQLSGEVSTLAGAFGAQAGGQFLALLLDPFAPGRNALGPSAYAPAPFLSEATLAAGRAAGAGQGVIDPRRFAIWGGALGSRATTEGDAFVGSATRDSRTNALAGGVDLRLSQDVVVGVAGAGGSASGSLSGGLGTASAELAQVGASLLGQLGPIRFGAAAAYTWMDIETSRSIAALGGDRLEGRFDADVWSARAEARYEFAFGTFSIAPLAALQAQRVSTPAYTETNVTSGAPIGLVVVGRDANTSRTELGVHLEAGGPNLAAFARIAWAHYTARDAAMSASFIGLPGASFTIQGAKPDQNTALLSAGIEAALTPAINLGARFDGEFSENTRHYTGSARMRLAF